MNKRLVVSLIAVMTMVLSGCQEESSSEEKAFTNAVHEVQNTVPAKKSQLSMSEVIEQRVDDEMADYIDKCNLRGLTESNKCYLERMTLLVYRRSNDVAMYYNLSGRFSKEFRTAMESVIAKVREPQACYKSVNRNFREMVRCDVTHLQMLATNVEFYQDGRWEGPLDNEEFEGD